MRAAVSFLTVLPAGPSGEVPAHTLLRSAAFFPLAGWIIGGILIGGSWLCAGMGVAPFTAAVLLVGIQALLTRGLHLDGLADFFDGMGGVSSEARLRIMKDSSVGVFGVVGLVFVLLLKVVALDELLAASKCFPFVILAAPVAARWAMVGLAYKSCYPREMGTAHVFVGKVKGADFFFGGMTMLPVFFFGWGAVATVFVALLPALWLRVKAHSALGGVTGDVLGAACELGEAMGWLAASLVPSVLA